MAEEKETFYYLSRTEKHKCALLAYGCIFYTEMVFWGGQLGKIG